VHEEVEDGGNESAAHDRNDRERGAGGAEEFEEGRMEVGLERADLHAREEDDEIPSPDRESPQAHVQRVSVRNELVRRERVQNSNQRAEGNQNHRERWEGSQVPNRPGWDETPGRSSRHL
jgi:hypothetical protein